MDKRKIPVYNQEERRINGSSAKRGQVD